MAHPKSRVSNRIRELRFEHNEMTQKELAESVGVSRQTLNAIEGSKYSPSLEIAFRIAESLGVPLGEVFQHEPQGKATRRRGVSSLGDANRGSKAAQ